ncbi:MAG TPA: hypothetical protein VJS67_01530 [Pseudonocardiaceae bacterium]|nr:hypothetical protein [Pseudonocardiaceae bacterium]
MGRLAGDAAPVDLGAGVGLRSTKAAMATGGAALATGETAMLSAIQPAARGTTLLTVGGDAMRVLRTVLAGAPPADVPASVVTRPLAGTRTAARLVAAWRART